MSAIEALRLARENGVRLGIAGTDLILDADREPAPRVLEALRRHKAGIVTLLTAADFKPPFPDCPVPRLGWWG